MPYLIEYNTFMLYFYWLLPNQSAIQTHFSLLLSEIARHVTQELACICCLAFRFWRLDHSVHCVACCVCTLLLLRGTIKQLHILWYLFCPSTQSEFQQTQHRKQLYFWSQFMNTGKKKKSKLRFVIIRSATFKNTLSITFLLAKLHEGHKVMGFKLQSFSLCFSILVEKSFCTIIRSPSDVTCMSCDKCIVLFSLFTFLTWC